MERRSIGDDLDVVGIPEIGIGDGDGGAVVDGNGLRKRGAKIGVCRAAITDEPAGVDVEVHEVGEAADVLRSRRLASLEREELVEVYRLCALRLQVSVEEVGVADFVDGIAGDVLRAIGIEVREGSLIAVQRLAGVYLNGLARGETAQLRILCPQITFDELGR